MTRVVIDTNVFISSFFGGLPRKIIDLWKSGEITLCLTADIIDEYIEVLRRLGLRNESEIKQLLDIFVRRHHILFTTKTPAVHAVERDPDDNKFLECALALKAGFVISGDKDLTELKRYMDVTSLSPREFFEKFKPVEQF